MTLHKLIMLENLPDDILYAMAEAIWAPCGCCGGSGFHAIQPFPNIYFARECTACDGSGKVFNPCEN